MDSSPNIPLYFYLEGNSIILFNPFEKNFLLLKGEGRKIIENRTAKAVTSFILTQLYSD
jgi:hypothetical protein